MVLHTKDIWHKIFSGLFLCTVLANSQLTLAEDSGEIDLPDWAQAEVEKAYGEKVEFVKKAVDIEMKTAIRAFEPEMFSIKIDGKKNYISSFMVLAEKNHDPFLVKMDLSKYTDLPARIRVRIFRTGDIYVIAKTVNGLVGLKKRIKIVMGGCNWLTVRKWQYNDFDFRFAVEKNNNNEQLIKTLIKHPMETGYRRQYPTGKYIPADYIQNFKFYLENEELIHVSSSENISRNPFFGFALKKPVRAGQKIKVVYKDIDEKTHTFTKIAKLTKDGTLYNREFSPPKKKEPVKEPVMYKPTEYEPCYNGGG